VNTSHVTVILCFFCLLSGCTVFSPFGSDGAQGYIDRVKAIKAYGEYWVKDGMTIEQRRKDSWACGAAPNIRSADIPDFTPAEIQAARRPEDPNDIAGIHRLRQTWGDCMKSKGYEYRRTSP